MVRKVGSKARQQRNLNFMNGRSGRSSNYVLVTAVCLFIFGLVFILQKPHSQLTSNASVESRHVEYNSQSLNHLSPDRSNLNHRKGHENKPVEKHVEKERDHSHLVENAPNAIKEGTEDAMLEKGKLKCAIVIDAGSTGSRVHLFKFEVEGTSITLIDSFFKALEPGLSSYKDQPTEAGKSLKPLLDKAQEYVPKEAYGETTVEVRATAGLRLLDSETVTSIIESVDEVLLQYPFRIMDDSVSVMDGSTEGVYMWVSTNYYLGNIGKPPSESVSVIDLGGGSVQRAYAIEGSIPSNAPKESIKTVNAGGLTYSVYVYSYLGFGLKASRMKFLMPLSGVDSGHPCIVEGFEGRYHYVEEDAPVKPGEGGADVNACMQIIDKEMNFDEECEVEHQCSFDGAWSGGGGGGSKQNYVSSYLVDIARDVGIIPKHATLEKVNVKDFKDAAERVCGMTFSQMKGTFHSYLNSQDDIPYMCIDVVYAYILLNKGFDISESVDFTLVKQFDYKGQQVEAAWPLGAAIHTVGSQN